MKTKLHLPLIFSILLIGSCQKIDDQVVIDQEILDFSVSPLSITDPNDPNLNVNWRFYDPDITTALIYYGQRQNGQPVRSVETLLPWFTSGNPVNNEHKDYRPELGWVLYLKDFGTPQRPAQTPFFALYNKYSGVLRFFVYNYRVRNQGEPSKTYYIAELGFNNTTNYNASLSFFAPTNEFVKNKTNPNTKQIVVTKRNVSDAWLNFDFVMTYDRKFSELLLRIHGVNQAEINLGTDFSTLTSRSSVGGSGSTSGFHNAIEKGYEYIGSTETLVDAIDDLDKKLNPNRATATSVAPNSIIGTIGAAIGVVKGAVGLIKSFSGGKKSATATQTVIQYSGIVNTTGTATISNNLYNINFHQDPNASLTAHRYRPIYKNVTGLIGAPNRIGLLAYERAFHYPCDPMQWREIRLHNYTSEFKYDRFVDAFYENPDLVGKIRITKFDAYLINNKVSEIGLGNQHNTFEFLGLASSAWNNGLDANTVHTPPVNVGRYRDNDEVQIMFGRYAYPPLYAGTPFPYITKYPQIGIEIHYEIIDPNYPFDDSRERIIHKVVAPTTFDVRLHTGAPIRGECATRYEHIY
ncbi:hypothetical protein SAMN05421747_106138 [Parapedobacter composti]|uniref:Uncharacterized protein n=1 Tax=Parapedobacter composti TaxID=623281 RepID=A0A1I1HET0_9SPHI|nr:hypothetical protein [Parapedobacter composti]SFC22092.1 hypothetical protein SAMN05421747_106138 [Parapedobacter composti]